MSIHPAPGPVPQQMGAPALPPGAPIQAPGIPQLEDLHSVPKLFVQQKIDLLELFTNIEVSNQYNVYRTEQDKAAGMRWLLAKEESSCCQRQFCKPCREFRLDVGLPRAQAARTVEEQLGLVESAFVHPIVRLERPCFWCLPSGSVADGRGNALATWREPCRNLLYCVGLQVLVFSPKDPETPQYIIEGPSQCYIDLCGKVPCRDPIDFPMREVATGRVPGKIMNVPNGCCKMCFTTADDYDVEFDPQSSVQERGILLALTFAIDFRFFEAKDDKNKNHH